MTHYSLVLAQLSYGFCLISHCNRLGQVFFAVFLTIFG